MLITDAMNLTNPPDPDVLLIANAEGKELLRIDPEGNWIWPEDAEPDEAALIFARTVEDYLHRPL